MAKVKRSQQAASKGKKKKWHKIAAPTIFENKEIGESLVLEAEDMIGKRIKVNMMNLTGDIKKQNINVRFEVIGVEDSIGQTQPSDFELNASLIKRYVRRRRDRIDESLVYLTKDGKKIRIKPFILTRNRVTGSQLTDIRRTVKTLLDSYIKSNDYLDIFTNVISYNLQKELRNDLNKIAPLRNCEIRVLKLEKDNAKLSVMPKDDLKKKFKKDEADEESEEVVEKKKPKAKKEEETEDAKTDN
ncbi:hypothetical protein C0585_00430 [Candidatus Woesearchaeota archaeon]|nr:MAG: hypothetical protein C0585_00430 [Candidatus Woesearchaeota archaeon]